MRPRLTSQSSQGRRPSSRQRAVVHRWTCPGRPTLEQQPPKISPTVTPQLIRAGTVAWRVAAVMPMALDTVKGASGSIPGFAVSNNGPTLICLVPGGTCGSAAVAVTLRRRAPGTCNGEVAGLEFLISGVSHGVQVTLSGFQFRHPVPTPPYALALRTFSRCYHLNFRERSRVITT